MTRSSATPPVSINQSVNTPGSTKRRFWRTCGPSAWNSRSASCAPPTTSRKWRSSSRNWYRKALPIARRMVRIISALPNFPGMENSPRKILAAWRPARAWMWMNTKKTMPGTLPCGKRREGEAFWETPIGKGRPGWHIECSVMSMEYLGPSFDLHAGGEDLIFPHHENEIAQSESLTEETFSRFWMHVRFLLVEGEKMSKSAGNFFTLRDLLVKGHKPSSIRYLLTSVPYRKQLNFTFDGLKQAAHSVERLRNFKSRLEMAQLAAGKNDGIHEVAEKTKVQMRSALEDDLNTAQALGAIFDMVRDANTAADKNELRQDDKAPLLEALRQFDEIFAVLKDDDAEKMSRAAEWARAHGIATTGTAAQTISDAEVERLLAERTAAKKARDFARSDAIRAQLAEAGIVVEDTKDGIRWKRK